MKDDSISVGEAAKLISERVAPVSRQTVRRLIDRGVLVARWTRPVPVLWTRDKRGRVLRGHRLVSRASVEAFVVGELARREAGTATDI